MQSIDKSSFKIYPHVLFLKHTRMPANMNTSKANKHGSNGGFPGSRGPGMKISKRRRSKNSQEGQSGAKKHSVVVSTNQFLEIENLNSAMRNAHQANQQGGKSQGLSGSGVDIPGSNMYSFGGNGSSGMPDEVDFMVESGRLEPKAPSLPSVPVQPPTLASTTTASRMKEDAAIEIDEDSAYDFIPYDENMLTPNGKHVMCDDNVDDFEPENYEQFQQGEVLTKLPRNIMSDFGQSMDQNAGETIGIGYMRDADDLTYASDQMVVKRAPQRSSFSSSTGDMPSTASRTQLSVSSPNNKVRSDNNLSSPGVSLAGQADEAAITAPKVQDMQNPSPSSSLSTGSDRVAKATVRIDTKNVEGVS